jgi:hypothetical protein
VSLYKRLFMRRREVSEEMLLKYCNYDNALESTVDQGHLDDNIALHALAQQQRHRFEGDKPRNTFEARSITGLPMFDPAGKVVVSWGILMLFVDGLYTALFVPIEAAFDLPHSITSWTGMLDFSIGVLLCVDIFLRFHVPIELTSSFMTYRLKQVRHFYIPS